MRILIFNANIITGDGKTVLGDHSLATDGELIDEIISNRCLYYDRADWMIDAAGGFVIPGIINHHTHYITRGVHSHGVTRLPGYIKGY